MTRIYLFCLLWLYMPFSLNSQSLANIDSLLQAYSRQPADTAKLITANQIVNYYMYRDAGQAERFAREQLQMAKTLQHEPGLALAHYQLGIVFNNLDQIDSAKYQYQVSLQKARGVKNPVYISQALRALAILEFSRGRLQQADSINDLDLAEALKNVDSMGIALAYDFKGTINQNRGYLPIALTYALKGLHIFEKLQDSIRIADALNHLATLELNLGNYRKGIEYDLKALDIYEDYDDIYYQAQALNDIGVMYKNLHEQESALDYFRRSIEKSELAQVAALKAASLTNIGDTYNETGNPAEAVGYLEEAIGLAENIGAQRRKAISQNKLAESYLLMNHPQVALQLLDQVKEYAQGTENQTILNESLRHYSQAFEQLGQSGKALENFKAYKALSDTLLNREKVKTIEALRVQYDLQKKEASLALQVEEIESLNARAEVDRLTKGLYAGGMFSFLAISGGLFFGFRQRMKKNRIAREKQEAIYRQEIEHKKKELASQTLHLVQKNTFLEELEENLENMRKSPEKFKMEFRRMAMLLRKEKASDKDWETFKTYFAQVHNDFDQKLKTLAEGISEKEIRLAAFLRMNLTTKEIAATLNVLPESVLKSKYRLKQKLGLNRETELSDFLASL